VNENEWLAMRGFVDIVFGSLLVGRFLWHSSQLPGRRARLAQLMALSVVLLLLEKLGVWSWREIGAAARMVPIVWPLVAIALYFVYRTFRMWHRLQRAQFEIDWRREYQEVLMQQLEQSGRPAPNLPIIDKTDSK
jgi:hypothetical protein